MKIKPPPIIARGVKPPTEEDGEVAYMSDADMSVGAFLLSTLRCPLILKLQVPQLNLAARH